MADMSIYHERKWNQDYGLVSLLEVIKFHAGLYCSISKLAGAFETGLRDLPQSAPELKAIVDGLCGNVLPSLRSDCGHAGLNLVVAKINQILQQQSWGVSPGQILQEIVELNSRLIDSLGTVHFIRIPESQVLFFDTPHGGWDLVVDKFPEMSTTIEEASKSLGLGRDTACVFHLMGVMQFCLNRLAKSLKVNIDLNNTTWNVILDHMQKAVNVKQASTKSKSKWKTQLEPFYAEAISDLRAVKNAWRNPTMHFWRTYNEGEARKIYDRVREFALLMATGPVKYGTQ